MIETAARGAQFLLAVGIAYIIALWFALVAWTFRDIESRSRSVFTQVFSTLLVVLFFVPGLVLYLILRPKETLDQSFQRALEEEYLLQDLDDLPLCPGCQRAVDPEFVLCPHCQTRLRGPCAACSRLIDLRWAVCPYCAVPVDRLALDAAPSEAHPARVLEDRRADRRKRAVAAAAQRVGIDADELDAFTDALWGTAGHSPLTAGGLSSALSRRISSIGEISRLRGVGGQKTPPPPSNSEALESSPLPESSDDQTSSGTGNGSERFWADPIPAPIRRRNRSRSDS